LHISQARYVKGQFASSAASSHLTQQSVYNDPAGASTSFQYADPAGASSFSNTATQQLPAESTPCRYADPVDILILPMGQAHASLNTSNF
jgi:hypothetical protein